jgi:hypothetical protein
MVTFYDELESGWAGIGRGLDYTHQQVRAEKYKS